MTLLSRFLLVSGAGLAAWGLCSAAWAEPVLWVPGVLMAAAFLVGCTCLVVEREPERK